MKMDSRYYKGFTCNIEASTGYGSFTGKCKEIGFSTTRVHLQSVRQLFDEAVDNYLAEKEMTKDQDVVLVNQFIEAMEKLEIEMEPLVESKYSGYILTTKLKRIYEEYKDNVLSNSSLDSLRTDVVNKLRKNLEEKKKTMKKLTVEYSGYKLEVEIQDKYLPSDSSKSRPYIKGVCNELHSFVKSGNYENPSPIIEEFMRYADVVEKNR